MVLYAPSATLLRMSFWPRCREVVRGAERRDRVEGAERRTFSDEPTNPLNIRIFCLDSPAVLRCAASRRIAPLAALKTTFRAALHRRCFFSVLLCFWLYREGARDVLGGYGVACSDGISNALPTGASLFPLCFISDQLKISSLHNTSCYKLD